MTPETTSLRDRQTAATREQILEIAMMQLGQGPRGTFSHESIAEAAGMGARTVYRYFPDRAALMDGALLRVRELAGTQVTYPASAQELLDTLEPIYTGFDAIAAIATMVRSTPQGRQLRLAQNARRQSSYTRALADAVKDLPDDDKRLATAMLQVLHTTPWLEMRDHWALSGKQIARATGWAVRTLLNDLRRRGSLPLDRDRPD